jgi:hypothetical protein
MKNQILKSITVALEGGLLYFTASGSGLVPPTSECNFTFSKYKPSPLIPSFVIKGLPDILQGTYGGGTAVEFERRSTLSFDAIRHTDGHVTGHLIYMFRDFDLDFKVQMAVDCMTVDGNRAYLGGTITKISANFPLPPFPDGSRGSIQVEDNGNNNPDLPDRYSDFHFFRATCSDELEPYIPLDGNIVVNP